MKSPPRHRFGEVADRGKSATIRHLYDSACALTQVKANEQKLPCQSNRSYWSDTKQTELGKFVKSL